MNVIDYGNYNNEKIVIALGYFDSIHSGHQMLLEETINLSKELNALSAVLLFTGNFKGEKDVFTLEERLIKIKALKIDRVISKKVNKEFIETNATDFLDQLLSLYNVEGIVVGEDFTFGFKKLGNVHLLNYVCKERGIALKVLPLKTDENGEKISSTKIKQLLNEGNVEKINTLLNSNYFIRGYVEKGRELGRKIGYPTANMSLSKDKYPLKEGVYYTCTYINGNLYEGITNVGSQPTFNSDKYIVETYIKNFNGDLYNKYLTIYFISRIRDIKTFNSVEELKEQLQKDEKWLK